MAPLKRPAASEQVTSPKKRATMLTDDAAPKKHATMLKDNAGPVHLMQGVSLAVSASSVPQTVKEMLIVSMNESLGVDKESRHGLQGEVVHMIESVLLDEEKKLEQMVQDTQKAFQESNSAKVSQGALLEVFQSTAEEKTQELNAKQADLATAEKDIEAKVNACKVAEQSLSTLKSETNVAAQTKEKLEAALADVVKPTKDGQEVSKDILNSFVALCTTLKCDQAMLTSLPVAFGKSAGELGSFDRLVLQHAEDFIVAQVALHKESVSQSEADVSAIQAKLEAAKEELQHCMNVKDSLEVDVKSAELMTEQAAANVQAEIKTLKNLELETKSADTAAEAAKVQLETFREGALAAFKQLVERSSAPAQEPAMVTDACSQEH